MDPVAQKIMEDVVVYISTVQPQLDKFASFQDEIIKQAQETAAILAHCGIVDEDKKAEVMDAFVKDPSAPFKFICKMAKHMQKTDTFGAPSEKLSENNDLDPFERWVVFGHPNAAGSV